jgi:histidyl-tRNA synthetase
LVRPIGSAVDKLDKMPWEEVKKEMERKGLETEVADKIGAYVLRDEENRTFSNTLEFLKSDDVLSQNQQIQKGMVEW